MTVDGGERVDGLVQVAAEDALLRPQLRHEGEDRLGAENHVGVGQQLTGANRQAGQPVRADADDVDAGFGCTHDDLECGGGGRR